jgi:hypothetical protein
MSYLKVLSSECPNSFRYMMIGLALCPNIDRNQVKKQLAELECV